jgi:hypothetical protein
MPSCSCERCADGACRHRRECPRTARRDVADQRHCPDHRKRCAGERQAGLSGRMLANAIERDLGPVANPHEVADKLMTQARDTAAPLYDASLRAPVADAFMSRRSSRCCSARRSRRRSRTPSDRGRGRRGSRYARAGQSGLADKRCRHSPSWKTLDYIKRGMDDVVESYRDPTSGKLEPQHRRPRGEQHAALLSECDGRWPIPTMPPLGPLMPVRSRASAAMNTRPQGAQHDGRRSRSADARHVAIRKAMAALGTRRAMAELVRARVTRRTSFMRSSGPARSGPCSLACSVIGKQFQRFVDTLGRSAKASALSSRRYLDRRRRPIWRTIQALEGRRPPLTLPHGGIPVATATSKAIKFLGRELGEKAQQQIAALLSNTDPAAIRELAAELRAQAEKRGLRVRLLELSVRARCSCRRSRRDAQAGNLSIGRNLRPMGLVFNRAVPLPLLVSPLQGNRRALTGRVKGLIYGRRAKTRHR